MTVDPAVLEELDRLRGRLHELSGSVLATTDGLVVAHDAHDIEPDSIAALAAAHLALARRFAHAVNHGDLRESVVECDRGYITSYTAGPNALLTLVTSGDANLAMVHLEARRCVRRLVRILRLENPRPRPEIPQQAGPPSPLARRTPMASLSTNARRRQAAG
ncbi:roadblock/LC7 domain-containing protein [Paractinoplanes lichenicola]|uniref:Roadblock/LC7 domain-containing protein n=1 Tax=Paractinoplanes lichenicola TaxID=2802976 RepID=A0ABS1VNH7_9ACTN|nr:roadblock/LC7 domain-containing protein [Actinoplanes lichenicola]MBL7256188.1 roadblock/LC7 domain-containing protein [Actinoplanes lichenicola]